MSIAATSEYPITFAFDPPAKVARWRPLIHWLLAIPHFFVLFILGIVAQVLVFISWFVGVVTGTIPEGLQGLVATYIRYSARVMTYQLFLTGAYPPFTFEAAFADPGDYGPVRVEIAPQTEGRSRLTIFFRYFMIIPHMIVLLFVMIGLYVVIFLGFLAVIITGNWPTGLRNYVVGVIRWNTRVNGYFFLLTDDYPPFGFS